MEHFRVPRRILWEKRLQSWDGCIQSDSGPHKPWSFRLEHCKIVSEFVSWEVSWLVNSSLFVGSLNLNQPSLQVSCNLLLLWVLEEWLISTLCIVRLDSSRKKVRRRFKFTSFGTEADDLTKILFWKKKNKRF